MTTDEGGTPGIGDDAEPSWINARTAFAISMVVAVLGTILALTIMAMSRRRDSPRIEYAAAETVPAAAKIQEPVAVQAPDEPPKDESPEARNAEPPAPLPPADLPAIAESDHAPVEVKVVQTPPHNAETPPVAELDPARVLADAGLRRVERRWILEAEESAFQAQMAATRSLYRQAVDLQSSLDAAREFAARYEQTRLSKLEHDLAAKTARNERMALPKAITSADKAYVQNLNSAEQFHKDQANLLGRSLDANKAQLATKAQFEAMEKEVHGARVALLATLPALREACDSVKVRYDELRAREDIHRALDQVEPAGAAVRLGPSARFERLAAELRAVEKEFRD